MSKIITRLIPDALAVLVKLLKYIKAPRHFSKAPGFIPSQAD
jgi:hypothetical protein